MFGAGEIEGEKGLAARRFAMSNKLLNEKSFGGPSPAPASMWADDAVLFVANAAAAPTTPVTNLRRLNVIVIVLLVADSRTLAKRSA